MSFEHVLVVGAGQMGGGIAQVVAATGRRVSLLDAQPGATDRALEAMRKSLGRLEEKGGPPAAGVLACIEAVDDLVSADLMIEAVIEDADVKEEIFRRADLKLPTEAVLASNTSSIPIGSLAAATQRPDKVIGMHFFNPVPVLELVEIIRGRDTSDETADAITALARELGKTPAVANDFPGFVSNRILMPSSTKRSGRCMTASPRRRRSTRSRSSACIRWSLALADLIGLDTCIAIMEVLQEVSGTTATPCPLFPDLVAAGKLGEERFRFYEYS
jgi:3-hydroxybutyryl-CoA dehydrogenase